MTTRSQALALATAYFDNGSFQKDLARRVACATASDAGGNTVALQAYLGDEMQPCFESMGFVCQMVDNPVGPDAPPLLIARRREDEHLPTMLCYGHGDVVSGQDAQWQAGLSPWTLTERGGKWYGRGTADNKGQHSIALGALQAVLQARGGTLGYNITWLMEMGEEAGSPGLAAVCEQHRQALAADVLIASDGPRLAAERPTLFLGSRGAVNFSLQVQPRDKAYHSGNWGGVLSNPATVLANAIASMVDGHGRLLVANLRPPPLDAALKAALTALPIAQEADAPELTAGWGEPGLSPAERLVGWNTLEVLTLGSGNPERPMNAIPAQATAHCQLRHVPGTDWQHLEAHVRAHLDAHGFADVAISIGMACAATRLPLDNPWVAWCLQSLQTSSGKTPDLLPNLAGSLPNDVFANLLGLPTLWIPHSYPACAQHAPNEHLLPHVACEGLAVMAGVYWDLGEANAPFR